MKSSIKLVALLVAIAMMLSLAIVGCSQKEEPGQEAPAKEETGIAWPQKSIQIIVPAGAGGDTDFNARMYAKYLKDILGVSIVVTNVKGNGGAIGMRQVLDSAPDGNTVLFYHTAMHVTEASGIADKGINDFDIACIAAKSAGTLLVVDSKSPYKTLNDIVEASKENPNKITFAANTGAQTYLTGLTLNEAGAKFNLIDVGGGSDRIAALKGGHVDIISNTYGLVKDYIDNGDFRPLALLENERASFGTDIPTVSESGFPDSTFDFLYFFAFPKGTPKEIIEKFSDSVEKVTQISDYAAEIQKNYYQEPYFVASAPAYEALKERRDKIMKYQDLLKVK